MSLLICKKNSTTVSLVVKNIPEEPNAFNFINISTFQYLNGPSNDLFIFIDKDFMKFRCQYADGKFYAFLFMLLNTKLKENG